MGLHQSASQVCAFRRDLRYVAVHCCQRQLMLCQVFSACATQDDNISVVSEALINDPALVLICNDDMSVMLRESHRWSKSLNTVPSKPRLVQIQDIYSNE